jgi:hypothetical protein
MAVEPTRKVLNPYKAKLNNDSYALGISKHIPSDSVNLAYIASPEISPENVSIVNEEIKLSDDRSYGIYYANSGNGYTLEDQYRNSLVPFQDVLITDEFSIKRDANDEAKPLFYIATLKKKINGSTFANNSRIVPYQYGYTALTDK